MTKPIYRQKTSWLGVAILAIGFIADPAVLALLPVAWGPLILKVAGFAVTINSLFFTRRADEPFPVSVPGA